MRRDFRPSSNVTETRSNLTWVLLVGGLLLAGIASLAVSLVPFGSLLAKVRGMSASGQGTLFDYDFYRGMQFRLRLIGLGNIAAAGAVFGFRRQISLTAQRVKDDFYRLAKDIQSATMRVPAADALGLILLTLFAIWLRLPLLFQPMRDDEAYSYLQYAAHPFYVAVSFYNAPNNHLFHTLLVWISYRVLGNQPWALRMPVLLAGLCLVPATYVAARSLYRSEGALLAAGLVASSSILIEFSTNARGYGLVCLVSTLLISVAAYALGGENWAAWFVVAGLSTIGFYTIPIMLYPFGGIVVWLLLSAALGGAKPNARSVMAGLCWAVAFAAFATVEVYMPVFAVSGPGAVIANKWVKGIPFHIFLRNLPLSLASTWTEWNRDLPWLVVVMLLAGFVAGLIFHRRCSQHRVPLALSMLLWILPLVFIQRVVPFERVWLFALPLYFVVASAGVAMTVHPLLERLRLRHAMVFVAIALSLLAGIRVQHSHSIYLSNEGRGIEDIALYLKQQLKAGDSVVAVLPSDSPLRYYFQQHGVSSSYLNAPPRARTLVLVNEESGDTLGKVLELAKLTELENKPAKLIVKYDSACLYEVSVPAHEASQRLQNF